MQRTGFPFPPARANGTMAQGAVVETELFVRILMVCFFSYSAAIRGAPDAAAGGV